MFSIKDFLSKCDQICRFLRIWPYLLKKSLMENVIFCGVSKNVYNDKLDNIAKKYSNTYHRTVKVKPINAKPSTYIDSRNEAY